MRVVHVTRKPLQEGSVVKNVLKYGVGAVNIDASRIATGDSLNGGAYAENASMGEEAGDFVRPSGRFPANVLLEHLPGCRRAGVGVLRTNDKPHPKNTRGTAAEGGQTVYHSYGALPDKNFGHADENGNEFYEAWECAPGCIVPDLNAQSGTSKSSGGRAYQNTNDMYSGGWGHKGQGIAADPGFGDTGGAARYFFQIAQETPMSDMPAELLAYLRGMISPDHLDDCVFVYGASPDKVDWASYKDASVHAMVLHSPPDGDPAPWMEEIWRVLKPGAHLMLVAPEGQPTGHTGAIRLEDRGFEIRDAILRVQEAGKLHYVPKPSRKERHLGTERLAAKRDPVLLVLKNKLDDDEMAEVAQALSDAGVSDEIIDNLDENGIKPALVPEEIRSYFKSRAVDARYGNSHPTVKARDIMARLLHDVPTDHGPVLDPFMGSGSAALSCLQTGHDYIGIEREAEYIEIADARVRYWDSAEHGWNGADIRSEAPSTKVEEARDEVSLFDMFDS